MDSRKFIFILRVYAVSVLYNHDLLIFAVENESQPIQELSSIPKRMLPFMTDENSMDSVASSNISGITYLSVYYYNTEIIESKI